MYVDATARSEPKSRWHKTTLATENDASASIPFVPLICLFAAGTMGQVTEHFLEQRSATANSSTHFVYAASAQAGGAPPVMLLRTPAEDIARIREILKPTVLELANLFGVSRQAVYDWQAGAQPSRETAVRLTEFARAADIFAKAGAPISSHILRRKVAGGGTVLETLVNGGNVTEAASVLVQTLRREAKQREQLSHHLAGRKRAQVNIADYGAPSFPEEP